MGDKKPSSNIADRLKRMGVKPSSKAASEAHIKALEAELASLQRKDGEEDSAANTREARTMAQWINSMDIEGVYVRGNNLARDLRDGTALLKVMDVIEPGLVQWQRVNTKPPNRFKMVENCNYIVTLGKNMDFHLVNVAGADRTFPLMI
jgi:hypothetical protein